MFGTETIFEQLYCTHWESIGSFKDHSSLIGYVSQLKIETEGLIIEPVFSMVLDYMWNRNFLEVVITAPKVGSVNLHA